MIRFETEYGYSNTWWKVLFVDNDETFIGQLERKHWHEFTKYEKGEHVKLFIDDIQHILKPNEQFCYSDNITICECQGLCKDK
jgi:hypothetical protein